MFSYELNKITLTFRQRGRVPWGRPLCMIIKTKAVCLRELNQGLCINLDGEGDGREVQEEGDICIPMADLC